MKKLFLILFFVICTNMQIKAMEGTESPRELPTGITINNHYFNAQAIRRIINICITEDPELAEDNHRGSLCLFTINLLKISVFQRLSREIQDTTNINQIENIRAEKLKSPRSFISSMEKEFLQEGNVIYAFILDVLNERDEEH